MEPCNQEKYFINLTIVLISMKCNHSNKVFHHQAHEGTNIQRMYVHIIISCFTSTKTKITYYSEMPPIKKVETRKQ